MKWDLTSAEQFVKQLDFSKANGLVVVITQDWQTNEILMCGFANREAIVKSLMTGYAYYFSRSRKALWKKGETSGHVQEIKEVLIDCDGDAVLFKIEQKVATCHKGYRSCFHRKLNANGELKVIGERIFDPEKVY
ncbi:MAG: phosphoribosyl-AMP cyclohydrolase [Candidatus Helarchaeota archaeon]|nr:phosphoribosyl-AMP cyclohydrolase [Candidatus Helarchaeota archaeon]